MNYKLTGPKWRPSEDLPDRAGLILQLQWQQVAVGRDGSRLPRRPLVLVQEMHGNSLMHYDSIEQLTGCAGL